MGAAYARLDAATELRLQLRQMRMNDYLWQRESRSHEEIQARQDDHDAHERQIAGLLSEADLYVRLAACDHVVGIGTGEWVDRFHQDKLERERADDDLFGPNGAFEFLQNLGGKGSAKDETSPESVD